MELNHNWRSFQQMFYTHRRHSAWASQGSGVSRNIYLILDEGAVLVAFAENEDLSELVGSDYSQVAKNFKNRELIALERKDVDKWLEGSFPLPHFYDQIEFFRSKAAEKIKAGNDVIVQNQKHFILGAIQSWWQRFLPSAYGVYIRVEGQPNQEILLIVRRGALEEFYEPDLGLLSKERRSDPALVVKYLSEKYLVPVQGALIPACEWAEWAECADPWRRMVISIRAKRTRLVPFRWGVYTLMASRAVVGT